MGADKDRRKKHAANVKLLEGILYDGTNIYCADCNTKGGVGFASLHLGTFICRSCADIHMNMSHPFNDIKSIYDDEWCDDEMAIMIKGGNKKSNQKFDVGSPPDKRNMPNFICIKYNVEKDVPSRIKTLTPNKVFSNAPDDFTKVHLLQRASKNKQNNDNEKRSSRTNSEVRPSSGLSVSFSPTVPNLDEYRTQLQTLTTMGFTDRERNIAGLHKNNGNIDATIEYLVSDVIGPDPKLPRSKTPSAAPLRPPQHNHIMNQLKELGFTDSELNSQILISVNGNIEQAIDKLTEINVKKQVGVGGGNDNSYNKGLFNLPSPPKKKQNLISGDTSQVADLLNVESMAISSRQQDFQNQQQQFGQQQFSQQQQQQQQAQFSQQQFGQQQGNPFGQQFQDPFGYQQQFNAQQQFGQQNQFNPQQQSHQQSHQQQQFFTISNQQEDQQKQNLMQQQQQQQAQQQRILEECQRKEEENIMRQQQQKSEQLRLEQMQLVEQNRIEREKLEALKMENIRIAEARVEKERIEALRFESIERDRASKQSNMSNSNSMMMGGGQNQFGTTSYNNSYNSNFGVGGGQKMNDLDLLWGGTGPEIPQQKSREPSNQKASDIMSLYNTPPPQMNQQQQYQPAYKKMGMQSSFMGGGEGLSNNNSFTMQNPQQQSNNMFGGMSNSANWNKMNMMGTQNLYGVMGNNSASGNTLNLMGGVGTINSGPGDKANFKALGMVPPGMQASQGSSKSNPFAVGGNEKKNPFLQQQ